MRRNSARQPTSSNLLIIALIAALFTVTTARAAHADDFENIQVIGSIFPPYSYDNNNKAEGIAVDVVRNAFELLGETPKIELYPWARALSIAENRPNTLFFSIARTPAREDQFLWIGTIIDFDVKIYRKASRTDIAINSEDDLKRYSYAGLMKDVKSQYLKSVGAYVHDISNEENGFKMVQLGRVDLVASDKHAAEYRIKELGYSLDDFEVAYSLDNLSKPLYIVASQGTDMHIVKELRAALATLQDR